MAFRIGFETEHSENGAAAEYRLPEQPAAPRRSVVQVWFAQRNMNLAYYNDRFDLHRGDQVYVEGKLEGLRGYVTDVNYNFRIKLSNYKRVIARVDTSVRGEFFFAGSHLVTFDRGALPVERVLTWFCAPLKEDDEFASGCDDSAFDLYDPRALAVSPAVAERGQDYYTRNKVRYLCLDGTRGYAIVEGTQPYEVEFELRDGMVSGLTCSCFCGGNCKHMVAVLLQLRETLEAIGQRYAEQYGHSGYFAAVNKATLFDFALEGREGGSIRL